jgi:hypothetical protein
MYFGLDIENQLIKFIWSTRPIDFTGSTRLTSFTSSIESTSITRLPNLPESMEQVEVFQFWRILPSNYWKVNIPLP